MLLKDSHVALMFLHVHTRFEASSHQFLFWIVESKFVSREVAGVLSS
jgi:hypothetical protein